MFAASPFSPRATKATTLYQRVDVDTNVTTANPHKLVAMLFDGLCDSLDRARGAMLANDIQGKGQALGRAVRIIEEGLRAALNQKEGGQLARDLNDLYVYMNTRLTYANAQNDVAAVEECRRLITPIKEAWDAIAPRVNAH
jgi:flagellar protein FliS